MPSGSVILEMCSESVMSRPVRSATIFSGMLSTGAITEMRWRTTLSTPPRRMPGDWLSLMNCTGTSMVMVEPGVTRMKSTCIGRSVSGSIWKSRGSTRIFSPSTAIVATVV